MDLIDNTTQMFSTNNSEVNITLLQEAYRIKEHEIYIAYRPVACTFGLLIFLSNITVVVSSGLILKKGQQPKSTYLLLGNVSLADTIIGLSMLIGFSFDNPSSSSPVCIFVLGMLVCPAMVSIFTVGLIAVDRYIYILHGLYYQQWVNTTKVRISIMFVWIIGLTLGFLPATGWKNHEVNSNCYYVAVFPGPLILLNSILSSVPIIVVAVLYTIILISALRNMRKINANQDKPKSKSLKINRGNHNQSIKNSEHAFQNNRRSMSFTSRKDFENMQREQNRVRRNSGGSNDLKTATPDNDSKINGLQLRSAHNKHISGSSMSSTSTIAVDDRRVTIAKGLANTSAINEIKKLKKREATKWRAVTIVMLTTGSFICTWMPFFISVIFYVICEDKETNANCFHLRLMLAGPIAALAFLNSILNPLIYAWWHKGLQRYIKVMWRHYVQRCCHKNSIQ